LPERGPSWNTVLTTQRKLKNGRATQQVIAPSGSVDPKGSRLPMPFLSADFALTWEIGEGLWPL
jgi:hypothetical protein